MVQHIERMMLTIYTEQHLLYFCHDKVTARDHSVYLMIVNQHQVAADSQTKPTHVDCESAYRLLSSTCTIGV